MTNLTSLIYRDADVVKLARAVEGMLAPLIVQPRVHAVLPVGAIGSVQIIVIAEDAVGLAIGQREIAEQLQHHKDSGPAHQIEHCEIKLHIYLLHHIE